MAEVKEGPLFTTGILYSEKQLASFAGKYSRLKPVEYGDVCCHCGGDCDGEGFAAGNSVATRINGHPICTRFKCYGARWDEFNGIRTACGCGLRGTQR